MQGCGLSTPVLVKRGKQRPWTAHKQKSKCTHITGGAIYQKTYRIASDDHRYRFHVVYLHMAEMQPVAL